MAAPPVQLDAAIVFAPAGEIVPAALKSLRKGGVLVLGGIHMSPIPSLDYNLLYQERVIRSVANNTRQDGEDFLKVAAEISIRTHVEAFPLSEANRALNSLKNDAIFRRRGAYPGWKRLSPGHSLNSAAKSRNASPASRYGEAGLLPTGRSNINCRTSSGTSPVFERRSRSPAAHS